jgi:LacI family transcriptional regulator
VFAARSVHGGRGLEVRSSWSNEMSSGHLTRSPTIADVARAAGVSISTASRVARDLPDVNAETRARVASVIKNVGYRPSRLARALVAGRSQTIALLMSDIANPFYPALAKAVEKEIWSTGYSLVICNTEDDPGRSVEYVQRLLDQGVAGFIHASVGADEGRLAEEIGDSGRVVFINRRPQSPSSNFVVSDDLGGARAVAEHLTSLGHKRLGYIGGPHWSGSPARLAGLRQAITLRKGELLVSEENPESHGIAETVETWMAERHPPTAIVGFNDRIATAIMVALFDRGITIPGQVSVAGFDNTEYAAWPMIDLTSVAQDIDEMARLAVGQLTSPDRQRESRTIRAELPMHLIVRGSTGPAPLHDHSEIVHTRKRSPGL